MADISLARSKMLLLSGTANRPLAEEIAAYLGQPLCQVTIRRFADGEIFVRIDENVRGQDVYIIQPTNPPGDNIIELLILIDAARRASAARISAVVPYFGYARQDRKDQPRVAISAKLMANLITTQKSWHDLVVVAPDAGGAKMARGFAKRLNASLAIVDKRRPSANVAEVLNVVGEVEDRDCLMVDDMIDTAGTMCEAARALKRLGAREIYGCASHALLSGPALDRLSAAPITELAVTNTIRVPDERRYERLKVLSIAPLLAQAVRNTHSDQSVSSLFD
ncbi:MAG: ribose-phosphate diphosphokinase [Gemmatimonadetes bacterium]|nr:ribose-phosphate diphosphokinase [Gemmatimonadota bacterium]